MMGSEERDYERLGRVARAASDEQELRERLERRDQGGEPG